MRKRTYVDACLLLAAFRGKDEIGRRAMEILDDPERALLVSDAVWLEVFPKPRYEKQTEEAAFYEAVFEQVEKLGWNVETLYHAHVLAETYGIAAMDAIHVATAIDADVEDFVTAEKPTKPMFRVQSIRIQSIREGNA